MYYYVDPFKSELEIQRLLLRLSAESHFHHYLPVFPAAANYCLRDFFKNKIRRDESLASFLFSPSPAFPVLHSCPLSPFVELQLVCFIAF